MMQTGLDTLFLMLRNADIHVGLEEIARLSGIFALEPALDDEGLRRVLMCTLVKSVEEREVFLRVYQKWFATLDGEFREHLVAVGEVSESARSRGVGRRAKVVPGAASALASTLSGPGSEGDGADESEPDDADWLSVVEGPKASPGVEVAASADAEKRAPAPVARTVQGSIDAGAVPQTQMRTQSRRGSRSFWLGATAVLLAVLGVVFGILYVSGEHGGKHGNDPQGVSEAADAGPGADVALNTSKYPRTVLVVAGPEIVIEKQPPPERSVMGWIFASASLILLIWMWARFGRGTWLPSEQGARAMGGTRQESLRANAGERRSLETLMLDERDEEELVWGVGRFVSDERGRELDIERTVRETASAYGRPVLIYEGSQFQREVWLWVDESLDTSMARQLADDLTLMLEKSGLPVKRATFWGMPERLRTSSDEVITIDAFDSRRDGVAVAILTDGRIMSLAHRARNRRAHVNRLLRNLSFWPRVTFIDFGDDRLAPICQDHGLRVIRPQDAASAISEFTEPYRRAAHYDSLVGDARVWAAVCSLSPHPVPENTALALRRELALEVSPWMLEQLRKRARTVAGGLDFSIRERASLLTWLVDAEDLPERPEDIPRTSVLARAVQAWQRVLDRWTASMERQSYKSGYAPPSEEARREMAFARAAILLWTDPDRAVGDLYRLHRSGNERQRQEIERYLRHLGAREHEERPGIIELPWSLSRLRRETRVMLHELGFAGSLDRGGVRVSMPAPGRLWISIGLCVGLFVGAFSALANQYVFAEKPLPAYDERGDRPPRAYVERQQISEKSWRAEVGTPWTGPMSETVKRGDRVTMTWAPEAVPCVEEDGTIVLRRCFEDGQDPNVIAVAREFWSFAIIVRNPMRAEKVAKELLQSGSVDGVYTIDSPSAFADIPLANLARPRSQQKGSGEWDQLLIIADEAPDLEDYTGRVVVIASANTAALTGMTDDFDGLRSLAEQRPRITPIEGDPTDFRVFGTGKCGGLDEACCVEPRVVCEGELLCVDSICVTTDCLDTDPDRCSSDTTLEVCVNNEWQRRSCAEGEICDREARSCRAVTCDDIECAADQFCRDGRCVARQCRSERELRCNAKGTSYQRCDVERGEWGGWRRCAGGSMCSDKSPCQPIERATIEFLEVKHTKGALRGADWRYKLECTVPNTGRDLQASFKLATSDERVSLPGKSLELPYGDSSRSIRINCVIRDLRPMTAQSSIRKGKEFSARAVHAWNADASGRHHMDFSGSGGRLSSKVSVIYKVELQLGLGLAPYNGAPKQDGSGRGSGSLIDE